VVSCRFAGGSPWFGTPQVVLEQASDEGPDEIWSPRRRHAGTVVGNDGDEVLLRLELDPPYPQERGAVDTATQRRYLWQLELPTVRAVVSPTGPFVGRLRFRIRGLLQQDGEAAPAAYELTTQAFTVSPPAPGDGAADR